MEKKHKKLFMIFLIGAIIGVLGFSGSFIMYITKTDDVIDNNTPDKDNNINRGLVFNSIDDTLYLEKAIPTLDKFGVEEKGFSFSIKNNDLRNIEYELKLVDDESTIMNKDIRYELTKNNEIVGIYSLNEDGIIDKSTINSKEEISYTIKLWLDYNSEVKVGRFSKKIAVNEINDESNLDINKPILTEGMIPVYYDYDSNNWYKADDRKWYSYEEGKWANVVTVNNDKRKEYQESAVGTKIEISDINSMWVWIPRFNYSISGESINISFIDKKKIAYPAFSFNGNELAGFWFSKFESSLKSDSECITTSLTKNCNHQNNRFYFVPNYPLVTKMTMANIFYTIRKMELKNNIYGFNGTGTKVNSDGTINNDQNNIDIHMIKNMEWQAVALLSNSQYGLNKKQVNNNSTFAGKSYYEDNEYDYNVLIKGEAASTTGNVTGIYDMSGGKREYVMINNSELDIFNKKSNSGFTKEIKDYYYDHDFSEADTTLKLKDKDSDENEINTEPITRGGYKNTGNIFNLYGAKDYIDKVSVETNSRACLVILKEKDYEEKKES